MANKISTVFSFSEQGNGLKKIKADVKEADGLFGKFKTSIKSSWQELNRSKSAQVAVGAGAAAMAVKSVQAASDLEESMNAVAVTYGNAGQAVQALGEDSAESFGLSQRAFNEFAVQFSAFAQQIAEQSGRSVVDVVEEMTTRVADFASVHNLSMQEAAQVVQSTMAGETEAFRRYGGDVSAATIKTYAYAEGIAEAGEELTESQKVLARYGAFMEQTSDVSGDFENTSDSLANQQRILQAQLEDTAAQIGENLIPVVAKLAQAMNETLVPAVAGTLGALDSLFDKAEMVGADVADVMFGGNRVDNRKFVAAVEEAERAAALFDRTLLDGVETFDEARAIGLEYADSLGLGEQATHAANLIALDYKKTVLDVAEATEAQEAATEAATKQQGKARAELKLLNQQYDNLGPAIAETTDEYWEAKRAVEGQSAAIDDLIGKQATLVGGDIAVRNSQREAAEAMREFNADAEDQQAEIDGVVEKQLAAAQAAADHRVEQLEASGEMVNSRQKAQIFADELGNLAGSLQGPVLEAVLRYIDELNRIPRNISSQVTFSVSGAKVTAGGDFIGSPTGFGGRRAAGGPTQPGKFYEVGENNNPELYEENGRQFLIPGSNGKVTPADKGGMGGVGVRDLHVHLDARGAIGMNEQQVRRWLVETLRQHVRFNGSIKGVTG